MSGHITMNENNPGVRSAGFSLLLAEAGTTSAIIGGA